MATELFYRWINEGVLAPDPEPSLYPYRMTDTSGRATTGVIGLLGLADPGEESDILPHEQTLPKPKSDRLDLLRATRANLSPIWGLSMADGVTATFDPTDDEPIGDVYDDDGVRHQLWVLSDPDAIDAVRDAIATRPGRAGRRAPPLLDGADVPGRGPPGQRQRARAPRPRVGARGRALRGPAEVGAIHRTVSGLPEDFDLFEAMGQWFDVVRAGAADARTLSALAESGSLTLVTGGQAHLLLPHADVLEQEGNDLDSNLIAMVLAALPPHEVMHRHSVAEALEALEQGDGQAAFLLRPVTVKQIENWANDRRRMPPKTTYFSPKPRTGMVFRSLDIS